MYRPLLPSSLIWISLPAFLPLLLLSASAQYGFISLDAGYSGPDYQDENGIWWTSDSPFVNNAGASSRIRITAWDSKPQYMQTLRYFPGVLGKYCYRLPNLTSNTPYLLRARFLYGNYDLQSTPPVFGLILDADRWSGVTLNNDNADRIKEYIVIAQRTFFDVCLCKQGGKRGLALINSLELRPLHPSLYDVALSTGYGLSGLDYTDYGLSVLNYTTLRYPFDPYDRLWNAYDIPLIVSTNETVNSTNVHVPSEVMRTALTGLPNTTIVSDYFPETTDWKVYAALYFAEIENVTREGERVFDIYMNADGTSKPEYLGLDIFKSVGRLKAYKIPFPGPIPVSATNGLTFELRARPTSTRPPLVSAAEVHSYSVYPHVFSSYPNDVQAIIQIQGHWNLTDWTGDPCMPSGYNWEWILCTSDSNNSRIIEMHLSSLNLTGEIPPIINQLTSLEDILLDNNGLVGAIPDLSNLTHLQKLILDNNRLSGPIPNILGELPNLKELSLQNNNLTGRVPNNLVERYSKGTLILRVSGNSLLIPPVLPNPAPINTTNNSTTKETGQASAPTTSQGGSIKITLLKLILACSFVTFVIY